MYNKHVSYTYSERKRSRSYFSIAFSRYVLLRGWFYTSSNATAKTVRGISMSVSFVVRAMRAVRSLMCVPSYLFATISRNAARNSSFSSSVPTDTRRQFSSIGAWEKSRTRMPRA